jgi:hypothetical protein
MGRKSIFRVAARMAYHTRDGEIFGGKFSNAESGMKRNQQIDINSFANCIEVHSKENSLPIFPKSGSSSKLIRQFFFGAQSASRTLKLGGKQIACLTMVLTPFRIMVVRVACRYSDQYTPKGVV